MRTEPGKMVGEIFNSWLSRTEKEEEDDMGREPGRVDRGVESLNKSFQAEGLGAGVLGFQRRLVGLPSFLVIHKSFAYLLTWPHQGTLASPQIVHYLAEAFGGRGAWPHSLAHSFPYLVLVAAKEKVYRGKEGLPSWVVFQPQFH